MNRRDLPPLDLLLSFEAAARHLSFTKAAAELFLTQSAISRQVQALEEQLGTSLFQRRHRALLLTDAGQLLHRSVGSVLQQLRETTRQIRAVSEPELLTVTTSVSFAALWLVPRLPRFRVLRPLADVRIAASNRLFDLSRDRVDVAIRYCSAEAAPPGSVRLFGEAIAPMCSPQLLQHPQWPLRSPEDLRHHVLLHDDDAGPMHWLEWETWLEALGLTGLKAAGDLRFSMYDQMVHAAIDGQGVALGRLPLMSHLLERGQLVMPFDRSPQPSVADRRAFYLFCEARACLRDDVRAFVDWVTGEAAATA